MNDESQNSLEIGCVLNEKWVILEFIAKGGMGEVYQAHQVHLKRDVAIKVISKEWLDSISDDDYERETGLQRFRNEVQAMARVRHPNVLQIYDYGTINIEKGDREVALEYIAMEYVAGGTLRGTMSDEGLDDEEELIRKWLRQYFFQVLDGVQAIHELKMAHRDLKPSNVLMEGETPKITDFGLAHSYEWQPVTQSIDIKGTPAYMSPEHFFEFGKADHLSDIYSLGKMLFEAIKGRISSKDKPFKQARLQNPKTPFLQKLDAIIRMATAEERDERYVSVAQLRLALEAAIEMGQSESLKAAFVDVREPPIWQKPRYIWGGIALAVLSMAAMGIWHLVGDPDKAGFRPKPDPAIIQPASNVTKDETTVAETTETIPPPKTYLAQDGIQMRFVPGGDFQIAESPQAQKKTVSLQPFYIDETKVTNHHFVEFLNLVKDTLIIEKGVVKQEDKIWFYMGQGTEPYEQIIYQHERFHLRNAEYAADPVVRITWYGAKAYAQHYGKRLPTALEWRYAASLGNTQYKTATVIGDAPKTETDHQGMHQGHMAPPAGKEGVNRHTSPDTIKEWVVRTRPYARNGAQAGSIVKIEYTSSVITPESPTGTDPTEFRYPWEGFPDVGFRCVLGLAQETQ